MFCKIKDITQSDFNLMLTFFDSDSFDSEEFMSFLDSCPNKGIKSALLSLLCIYVDGDSGYGSMESVKDYLNMHDINID